MQLLHRKPSMKSQSNLSSSGSSHIEDDDAEQAHLLDVSLDPLSDDSANDQLTPPRNRPAFFLVQAARTKSFYTTMLVVGMAIFGISMFAASGNDANESHLKKLADNANALKRKKSHWGKATGDDLPFPVINYDDEVPGVGTSFSALHASDTLDCKESVVSFVINATDAKDECDGLKRAFDKTCNSDEDVLHEKEDTAAETTDGETTDQGRRRLQKKVQRRRKLFEDDINMMERKLQLLVFQTYRWIHGIVRSVFWPAPEFYAEMEVAETYSDAKYLVENNLDDLVAKRRIQHRLQELNTEGETEPGTEVAGETAAAETTTDIAGEAHGDGTTSTNAAEEAAGDGTSTTGDADEIKPDEAIVLALDELKSNETAHVPKDPVKPHKPMQSLTLPTTKEHMSNGMLGEALMLQKEDSAIKKEIIAAANSTGMASNKTIPRAEAVEAAASQKAVQDATVAMTAVLNDPDTIEARTCCASILNVFHENCDAPVEEIVSDRKLFMIVFVIAMCGIVKSLIRNYEVRWLPEAAGCILVGVAVGAVISFIPHYDISFDGDWFLRIMVPPIVFEAALSIDKKSFNRHLVPITIYAVIGTLMATGMTAFILHKGTLYLSGLCETIPYVEALLFGSLISSIDPIAVLSVLSNMGMTDTDTIYVVIFGESLLNDGVAIVLFQTLVHFLDESLVIDSEAVVAACVHFLVVAFGSLAVGIGSGLACTGYYWMMQSCQTPLVEVLLFFCWAFTPYYICDGIGWSGIVSVVATGFVMDLFVVGQAETSTDEGSVVSKGSDQDREPPRFAPRRSLFNNHGHLSVKAKTHVGFVAEILATMMETAIFAYLGVFLFSYRYHWNMFHTALSIFACCLSRAIMIPSLSLLANWITRTQQTIAVCRGLGRRGGALSKPPPPTGVIVDSKMQLVLWVAGLRGAMSFALVEYIPLYDTVTGEGTRVKGELKAMTSATIIFTVFILGGYTFYLMERLGMTPNQAQAARSKRGSSSSDVVNQMTGEEVKNPSVRQRK